MTKTTRQFGGGGIGAVVWITCQRAICHRHLRTLAAVGAAFMRHLRKGWPRRSDRVGLVPPGFSAAATGTSQPQPERRREGQKLSASPVVVFQTPNIILANIGAQLHLDQF